MMNETLGLDSDYGRHLEWLGRHVLSDFEYQHRRSEYGAGRAPVWNSVGVIGGGTAGYLTALAIRQAFPTLDVTLIESSRIPIIGVGEATVPSIVNFLHEFLEIDFEEFYRISPTKLETGHPFRMGPA